MPEDIQSLLSIIVLPRGIDFSHEIGLIKSGQLGFERLGGRTGEVIFFERDAVVNEYKQAENTTHWYRCMSKTEFDALFKFNIINTSINSYTGIAPYRMYVKDGFFNKDQSTHIVEFGNTSNLSLDEDFSVYTQFHNLGFSVKAEGGGTFGLGDTGSISQTQRTAVNKYGTQKAQKKYGTQKAQKSSGELSASQLSELRTPADLFTEWLVKKKIYRKLVNLRLNAHSNAKATLEA